MTDSQFNAIDAAFTFFDHKMNFILDAGIDQGNEAEALLVAADVFRLFEAEMKRILEGAEEVQHG